jgi:hypothetical protein
LLFYFKKIRNPFVEAVKMTLVDRYTENIENIKKVSINLVIETLIKGPTTTLSGSWYWPVVIVVVLYMIRLLFNFYSIMIHSF